MPRNIVMPQQTWVPTNRNPIIQREFKGIDKRDPFSISPEFSPDLVNISLDQYPSLSVRPGYSVLGSAIGSKVLGLGVWKDSELHAVFNDGTWRKWTGSAWSAALVSGLDTSAPYSFCNFKGNLGDFNLIACNGVGVPRRYDGSTVQNLTGAPSGANFIDEHDNRLYAIVNGIEIHYCELSVPSNWTVIAQNDSDPGTIIKEINTGKKIVGLKAGTGHVTVYFPTSMHELYGTSPSDFSMVEAANDIGAINNNCAVNLDGVTYFVGDRGIYVYAGGARPNKRFSERVQWYIDNMNQAAKNTCCIGTDGLKLYVSIPMNSSTAPDTTLVYNPMFDTWEVWGGISALCMAKVDRSFYYGESNGRVLLQGGTTDNGAQIASRWVTHLFSNNSLAQRLRVHRIWSVSDIQPGSNMNIFLSKSVTGDSDWNLVGSVNSPVKRLIVPPSIASKANWARLKIECLGQVALHELSWEPKTGPLA
ncbi:hypothetical protein DVH26_07785 [Paenibacillus sp. H1-7]|uniref:hypothetical protein n=1 Tax=Paenibacillus sp. H1-7 TaxID=2282849 RepID=UPI001EF8760A|nr:hypothetical protein [Paenibacillus sp. H1-7]ULL14358.1 hypothetical protein DVH26_07785 [Paenibacillus sp. H1-7]